MPEHDNNKRGTSPLVRALAVAATATVVASLAVVGTVAAQSGQRFDDVPEHHYAYDAVTWAVENGITEGCGDGTNFCPDRMLSRGHMVTFLKRYHDKFGTNGQTDSDDSEDARRVFGVRGIGTHLSRSVTLTSGLWNVDFDVDHNRRLGAMVLTVFDSEGREEVLVDEVVEDDDYRESFRIRVGSGFSALDPGKIWFQVETIFNADWEIAVTEL